jgi:hypothetical protein
MKQGAMQRRSCPWRTRGRSERHFASSAPGPPATIYGNDPSSGQRLGAIFPLIGLRWVPILLNEFRPEYWRRRQLAGFSGDRCDVSRRQLDRARELLARLDTSSGLERCLD